MKLIEDKSFDSYQNFVRSTENETNNRLLFLIIVLWYILIGMLNSWFVPFYDLLLQSMTKQLTNETARALINEQKQWALLAYFLIPVFLLVRVAFGVITIEIGTIIFDFKVKFKQIIFIFLQAEFVFIFMSILKLIWVSSIKNNVTYEYLVYFTPFALSNLFSHETVEEWFIYPLQMLNLFEFFYWMSLSFLLSKKIKCTFLNAFLLILKTYVASLLMWILFLTFLKL